MSEIRRDPLFHDGEDSGERRYGTAGRDCRPVTSPAVRRAAPARGTRTRDGRRCRGRPAPPSRARRDHTEGTTPARTGALVLESPGEGRTCNHLDGECRTGEPTTPPAIHQQGGEGYGRTDSAPPAARSRHDREVGVGWARQGSNLRPIGYEPTALPLSYGPAPPVPRLSYRAEPAGATPGAHRRAPHISR